ERLTRAVADEDVRARTEKGVEAAPRIGYDRYGTCGGLEKAYAGREPGAHHVAARQVEREALRRVEGPMIACRDVLEVFHVGWPARGVVARAGHDESIRRPARRAKQQRFERRLARRAMRSHVPEIPRDRIQ